MNIQTVDELKIMSLNPLSSRLIGQDFTCIGGLILLLSTSEEKVISDILEIFHNLIVNENNKQYLKEFIGIKQQLEYLETKYFNGTLIGQSASKLKKKLFKEDQKRQTSVVRRETKLKDGFKIYNCRNYVISLTGLTDMGTVEDIKNCLVNLSGVMSITFQLKKRRVIVRARQVLTGREIVDAISSVSNHLSAELITPSSNDNSTMMNSTIGYLPEPANNDNKPSQVAAVNTLASRCGIGLLISRFSRAFSDYLW